MSAAHQSDTDLSLNRERCTNENWVDGGNALVGTSFDDDAARMVEQKFAKVVALGIEAGLLAQARRTEKRERLEGLEGGQALGDGDRATGDRHWSADPRYDLEDGRARRILEAQLSRHHAAQARISVLVLRRVIERAERRP